MVEVAIINIYIFLNNKGSQDCFYFKQVTCNNKPTENKVDISRNKRVNMLTKPSVPYLPSTKQ